MLLETNPAGITTLTLDNPPANAIGPLQIEELSHALAGISEAPGCRVLVLRGAGRFFCAGADIRIMQDDGNVQQRAQRLADFAQSLQKLFAFLENLTVPTIAVINGIATGGGLELAMACDFRIVAKEASLGLPETKLGLIPGAGGTQRLVRLIGRANALDLILRGRLIDGEEAVRMGLALAAVAAADVGMRGMALAEELVKQPRQALREAKHCINLAPSDAGFAEEIAATRRLQLDADTASRIAAFLARRAARP